MRASVFHGPASSLERLALRLKRTRMREHATGRLLIDALLFLRMSPKYVAAITIFSGSIPGCSDRGR